MKPTQFRLPAASPELIVPEPDFSVSPGVRWSVMSRLHVAALPVASAPGTAHGPNVKTPKNITAVIGLEPRNARRFIERPPFCLGWRRSSCAHGGPERGRPMGE